MNIYKFTADMPDIDLMECDIVVSKSYTQISKAPEGDHIAITVNSLETITKEDVSGLNNIQEVE